MPSRLALACAVAAIVAASAVGLLWSPAGADTAGRSNAAAAMAEYRQEARYLEARGLVLPSGSHWPVSGVFPESGPDGSAMSYGPGSGAQRADLYWFYSWARRAVARDTRATASRAAVEQLQKIRATVYYKTLIPDTRKILDEEIRAALAGDLSLLRRDLNLNGPSQ